MKILALNGESRQSQMLTFNMLCNSLESAKLRPLKVILPDSNVTLKNTYGFKNKLICLYSDNLSPTKLEAQILALQHVQDNYDEVCLVCSSKDSTESTLDAMNKKYNVKQKIFFIKYHESEVAQMCKAVYDIVKYII